MVPFASSLHCSPLGPAASIVHCHVILKDRKHIAAEHEDYSLPQFAPFTGRCEVGATPMIGDPVIDCPRLASRPCGLSPWAGNLEKTHEAIERRRCTIRPCCAGAARHANEHCGGTARRRRPGLCRDHIPCVQNIELPQGLRQHLFDRDDRVRHSGAGSPAPALAAGFRAGPAAGIAAVDRRDLLDSRLRGGADPDCRTDHAHRRPLL